jgi:hypothetical protein
MEFMTYKRNTQQRPKFKDSSKYKRFLNNVPLRSIIAINTSPKVIAGALRDACMFQ